MTHHTRLLMVFSFQFFAERCSWDFGDHHRRRGYFTQSLREGEAGGRRSSLGKSSRGQGKWLPPLTLPPSSPCCFRFSDPIPRLTSPPRPLTSSSPAPLETSSAPAMSLAVSGRRTSANLKTLRRRSPYTGEAQDTSICSAGFPLSVRVCLTSYLPASRPCHCA